LQADRAGDRRAERRRYGEPVERARLQDERDGARGRRSASRRRTRDSVHDRWDGERSGVPSGRQGHREGGSEEPGQGRNRQIRRRDAEGAVRVEEMSRPTRASAAVLVALCVALAQSASEKKGDAAKGKRVFIDHCAECHEPYSKEEKVGPGLAGIKDGKLPDGKPATREKLLDIINTGPAEMPSFKNRLTEQEKEDVVAFVMTL